MGHGFEEVRSKARKRSTASTSSMDLDDTSDEEKEYRNDVARCIETPEAPMKKMQQEVLPHHSYHHRQRSDEASGPAGDPTVRSCVHGQGACVLQARVKEFR